MDPILPAVTLSLLKEQGLASRQFEWHIRHLEHYLSQHSHDQALSPDHAIAYIRRQHKELWQLDQIRKAIDILFQSHNRPAPAGLWCEEIQP